MSTKKTNKKTKSKKLTQSQFEELETITKKMDEMIRRRLPDGVIGASVLKGMESEIRQEALIMSVGGFLQENEGYKAARKRKDPVAIEHAMERCAALTLQFCKIRIASRITKLRSRETCMADWKVGSCQHPSQLEPSEWPSEVKTRMIMDAVGKAVRSGKLSKANAAITSMICIHGMKVHEVALAWNVSDSAAYQQIQRIRQVIPEIIEQIDSNLH